MIMGFVAGVSEGSAVQIILAILTLFMGGLGLYVKLKTKVDRADILNEVDLKIAEEIKPISKRMDKHDTDFKDFKRDEIEPMKKDIHELITRQSVIDTKVDNVLIGIGRIEEYLKERDRSYKENFLLIFNKLEKKQDKK